MDRFLTTLHEFLRDLRAQKLRTFLTVFGIVWGTVAIIVLLAFGMGFKRQMSANMHGIGESIVIIFPGQTAMPFEGFGKGRPISFTEDDVRLLRSEVQGIDRISPEYSADQMQVRVGQNIINTSVGGIIPVYGDMRNIIPEMGGRFIDDVDGKERRRVIVLGDEVKRLLFGDGSAIGKIVYVGEVPFTVVGVMMKKTQPSSYNRRDQDRVFIPAATFQSLTGAVHLSNIILTHKDPTLADETLSAVRHALGHKYKFNPEDKDAVFIWDTSEFDKFLFYFFLAFNIFMGLIGSFTLGVGGIGVANIMFIVVQERIREIGVRRAVGATRRQILLQFFSESFFIILLGSSIGFLIALGLIGVLQLLPIKEFVGTPEFSLQVAIATALVLAAVGLSAGLFPARRAARLNVVDCLRS